MYKLEGKSLVADKWIHCQDSPDSLADHER